MRHDSTSDPIEPVARARARGTWVTLGWVEEPSPDRQIDPRDFRDLAGALERGKGAIEASRLARNGRDWHTLIEFCGLVGTILVDEDGIYDPRHPMPISTRSVNPAPSQT
jgi:hypothetical protein